MNNTVLVIFLLFFAWTANAATNSTGNTELVQSTVNSNPVTAAQDVVTLSSGETPSIPQEFQSSKTAKCGTLDGPVVEEALASIYGRYEESVNPNFRESLLA